LKVEDPKTSKVDKSKTVSKQAPPPPKQKETAKEAPKQTKADKRKSASTAKAVKETAKLTPPKGSDPKDPKASPKVEASKAAPKK
jgi:hypothetical protein